MPQYPKIESIEETQRHLSNIDEQIHKLEEVIDSDSETEENQCPIDQPESKSGIDESPDSSEYIYALKTKTAKKALKKVLKNPETKKEVLAVLARMDKGELLSWNEKNFKGFKELKEIKLTETRMLVKPGKKGAPDEIVAIFMKNDMPKVIKNLRKVYI